MGCGRRNPLKQTMKTLPSPPHLRAVRPALSTAGGSGGLLLPKNMSKFVPSVIWRYTKPKKRAVPAASRRALALRAGCPPGESVAASCKICGYNGKIQWSRNMKGKPAGWVCFQDLEIDHIIAHSKGGPMSPENLQLLCRTCNRRKADK